MIIKNCKHCGAKVDSRFDVAYLTFRIICHKCRIKVVHTDMKEAIVIWNKFYGQKNIISERIKIR